MTAKLYPPPGGSHPAALEVWETDAPEMMVAMAQALALVVEAVDPLPHLAQLRVLRAAVVLLGPEIEADTDGGVVE